MTLKTRAVSLVQTVGERMDTPDAKRIMAGVQWVLLFAVCFYLVYRLTKLGWGEIINALPTAPLFYVFFFIRFLILPLTEYIVYSKVWGQGEPKAIRPFLFFKTLPAFIRKRIYNYSVFGYSGEAFLTVYAQRHLGLSARQALSSVKDVNILSAFTANLSTIFLVIGVVCMIVWSGALSDGQSSFQTLWQTPLFGILFAGFCMATGAICVVAWAGRRWIKLPAPAVYHVVGWNIIRQIIQIITFIGMYLAAIPSLGLPLCLTFAALQLALARIPFLPNQELIYLSAALALSTSMSALTPETALEGIKTVTQAGLAGLLVAEAGLSQLLSMVLFIATASLAKPNSSKT